MLLSSRAVVFFLFSAFLLLGPVYRLNDIVAAVLAWGVLSAIILCATLNLLINRSIRRNLRATILSPSFAPNDPETRIFSLRPTPIPLRLEGLRILPGFIVKIQLHWVQQGAPAVIHILGPRKIGEKKERLLIERINFPHRGQWICQGIAITIQDILQLSITKLDYAFHEPPIFPVFPAPPGEVVLPFISSAEAQGDTMPSLRGRQGELFDFKQYHPSDGMRRILWKVFARSGELIARHPEPAMTPEGVSAVLVLAKKNDDNACALGLEYISQLEDLGIQVFVAFLGQETRPMARNLAEAQNLALATVWDSNSDEVAALVGRLIEETSRAIPGATISRLVIIAGGENLFNREDLELLLNAAKSSKKIAVDPLFFVTEPRTLQLAPKSQPLMRFLKDCDPQPQQGSALYPEFLQHASNNGWEVERVSVRS